MAGPFDRVFPFGYALPHLTDSELESANAIWNEYGLNGGEVKFIVCFFGAFGNQFDLETVVDASLLLEAENAGVRFVLCGAGERLKDLRARASGSRAVIFPGWVDRAQIWSLMAIADVGIAPYRNSLGFIGNLPNKPIDYLAGGLPIISALRGCLSARVAERPTLLAVLNRCGT